MNLRHYACRLAMASLVLTATYGYFGSEASAKPVLQQPARTVVHKKGKIGRPGGFMAIYKFTPNQEYYLDYTLTFRPGFDWDKIGKRPRGGKLPGLAGGTGTGGCRDIEPAGWSARQTWGFDGTVTLYLYSQGRNNRCGDKVAYRLPNGQPFRFQFSKKYRLTQRVLVNSPNAHNGEIQVWIDGVSVLSVNGLRLRGNVSPSTALVSQLKYHSYFGGNKLSFAPARDSIIDYGPMYVTACKPNFSKAPGTC